MADMKRPTSVTVPDELTDGPATPSPTKMPPPSKQWAEPDHPGPLFISKPRTPNGSFASDTVGVYQRTYYPEPLPYVERATPAAEGPDYPWLTSFQRKQMGIEDPEGVQIRGQRNPSGGFFATSEVASKVM